MKLYQRLMAVSAASVLLISAGAAAAHHSFAMFDMNKQVTLEGTIKDFRWTNPHSWMIVTVPDGKGGSVDWNLEGLGPAALAKAGWKRSDVKIGDKAVVKVNPLRDGSTGGSMVAVTINGRTLGGQAGGN